MNFIHAIWSRIKAYKPPYPGLRHKIEDGKEIWEGPLSFTARYDSTRVKDTFEVRIEMPAEPEGFPLVREVGGRIEKLLSQGKAKNRADLHINPNGVICLCPKPEEKRRFPGKVDLSKFIKELVIPYFYALHQFDKTGKWAWGQYSHGYLGIMEYYLEHRNNNDSRLLQDCLTTLERGYGMKLKRGAQFNGREPCFCGSGKRAKKCHPNALAGIRAIIEDACKLGMK